MVTSRTRRAAVLLSLLALAAVVAVAQPPAPDYTDERRLPDGRRGERIRQVLDAVDAGEAGRVDALVKDAFGGRLRELPIEEHRSELLSLHDRSQGLDFYGIRRYVPPRPADVVVVIAKNRLTGGWHGLSLTFDGTPEERITGLEVQPARPPKDVPAGAPVSLDQAMDELRAFIDRLAAAEAFSGTVLVARDGRPVLTAARGLADRNHAVPMRLDTKLNLGSMDKMLTAVVVGQLVDEGRLSFDDPVSKYLDASWTKADLSKVRVKHLLSHTSGLGSYFNDTYERTARQLLRKVSDYKPLVAGETLEFEPGTRSRYSNTGFLLAGAVIEAATGRDYFDVVRERVYARAGMKNSDSYDIDLVVPNLGVGYSRERTPDGARTWRANTFAHVIRGGPAGGGYSTVEDLLAFAEAMRAGRLVSAASRSCPRPPTATASARGGTRSDASSGTAEDSRASARTSRSTATPAGRWWCSRTSTTVRSRCSRRPRSSSPACAEASPVRRARCDGRVFFAGRPVPRGPQTRQHPRLRAQEGLSRDVSARRTPVLMRRDLRRPRPGTRLAISPRHARDHGTREADPILDQSSL